MRVNSETQSATQTVSFKVEVWSNGNIGSNGPLQWLYDVTVYKACINNNLSEETTPGDINYHLRADGSSTASQDTHSKVFSFGIVGGHYDCPCTRTTEIWDGAQYVTFSSSTYPWGSNWTPSNQANRHYFQVDWEVDQRVAGADMSLGVYELRIRTYDSKSEAATPEIIQPFTVTFTYECSDDYFSLSGVSEQTFQIGSSDATISLGMSQSISSCYKTVDHYYWNNSTSAWDALTSAPFYVGEYDNSIVIGASSRSTLSFAADESEQFYDIRVVWTSPYSTRSDGTKEELFKIRFYDACIDDALSISSQLSDVTYQIGQGTATYAASFSNSVGGCALTWGVEVYDEDSDAWVNLQTTSYRDADIFYHAFSSGSLQINYSTSEYRGYWTAPYSDHAYAIRITAYDQYSFHEDKQVWDEFTLTISYACALDELALSSNLGPLTQYIGGSNQHTKIAFSQSQSGCPLTYGLQFLQTSQIYQAYSSENYVSSFSSSTGDVYWTAPNTSGYTTYKPITEIEVRVTVTSDYSTTDTRSIYDDFTLTLEDQCYTNVLSVSVNPSDIAYLIDEDGSTPAVTEYATVTGSKGESRCPLTRTVEYWDDSYGGYIAFNGASFAWATVTDESSSYSRIKFVVDSEDGTGLDSATIDQTLYHMRVTTSDPYSADSSNNVEQFFDVSFNYECQDDYFTLAGVSMQSFYLGQSDYSIGLGKTQHYSTCAYTYTIFAYNNNTSEWEAANSGSFDWYRSENHNTLTIGVNSGSYASYRPQIYQQIKVVWKSTYSERTNDAEVTEYFIINFYERCEFNELAISTELQDYTYEIGTSVKSFTPSFTSSQTTSICPLTASCWIYSELQDDWIGCNPDPSGPWDKKDDYPSRFYHSFTTANSGLYQIHYSIAEYQADIAWPDYDDIEYQVKIRIEDPLSMSVAPYIEDTFTLTIQFKCAYDQISHSTGHSNYGHQQLIIGYTNSYLMQLTSGTYFAQTYSDCPLVFTLQFYDDNTRKWIDYSSEPYVHHWNVATQTYSDYGLTLGTGQLYLYATAAGMESYDNDPWFNVTARMSVESQYSMMEDDEKIHRDEFDISIAEQCRMVMLDSTMTVTSGGGQGVFGNPYTIDMWQLLTISMTRSSYLSPYVDPHSYHRCEVKTTLRYNDAHKTQVDTSKYRFDSESYPTQLEIQWDYGTFDDFFIVRIQVVYDSAGKNVVVVEDEQPLFVKVSNPCLVANGGAVVPDAIADIDYWIKDSTFSRQVPYFHDYPTDRDGGQTYLYTNGNDLCGPKSYEIVMADKSVNSDTAFLNLQNSGDPMNIQVYTILPEYFTNADVVYYIKVTLDDYKDDYYDGDEEAIYYEQFLLNMRNCQIQSYNKDADFTQTYILYTPVEKIPYTAWTDNAVSGTNRHGYSYCNYRVYYSVLWRNFYDTTLAIPQMVNWKWDDSTQTGTHAFWIYSDDTVMVEYDRQDFTIELTGCTSIADMNPIHCETWTLTVNVNNDCTTDALTLTTSGTYAHTFEDYTYYIHENTDEPGFVYGSGTLDHQRFHANWVTSQPYCPLDFEILRDYTDNVDGRIATNYEAFKEGEEAVITLILQQVITVPERDWSADVSTYQLTHEEQFPHYPYKNHYHNTDNNQVTMRLKTEDYDLLLDADGNYQDEVVWYLAVNRVSTKSDVDNSGSRIYFVITLADVCHDLPLTASEPYNHNHETRTEYLYKKWTYPHRYYQITNGHGWPSPQTYCGNGFTHYMMYESLSQGVMPDGVTVQSRGSAYVANEVENLFGVYTNGAYFNGPDGSGILLTDKHWVGTHNTDLEGIHVFYIRSYIGMDGGPRQGMYPSNYDDSTYSLTLTIKNPCNEAQLTIPTLTKNVDGSGTDLGNQVEVFEAREWGGQVVLQYELPWSDASDTYGPNVGADKYQLCGNLRHYVTTTTDQEGVVLFGLSAQNYNTFVAAEWLELEYFPDGDPTRPTVTEPPVFQLRINSTSTDDWGPHLLKLHFEFEDYPLSSVRNEEWHINAQIEYCLVKSWTPPSNFHVPFTVGMKPISIEYNFQQYPCTYGATYTVKLIEISGVVQSNQTPPSFIVQDPRSGYMTVYTNNNDDLGWYVLEITATLDVLDLLGDMDELNNLPYEDYPDDPDNIFLNTWLYDQGVTISTGMADPATVHPKLYGKESPPDDFIYEAKFNITLGIIAVNETSITENNTAPYLLPKPKTEHKIVIGEAWELQLGVPFDWEGNKVSVYMDLRNADQYFSFDPDSLTLSLPAGVTNEQTQPVFDVRLTLFDDHEFDPLSKSYDFTLVLVEAIEDPIVEIVREARKKEVFYDYGELVYDLTETSIDQVTSTDRIESQDLIVPEYKLGLTQVDIDYLREQEELEKLDELVNPKPAPVIESFSSDGRCKIRFNTPMKVPNLEDLIDSKVALRMTKAITENEIKTQQYLTEDGIADFQIRNAIEVNMAPSDATEDPIPVEFSWEIVSFSEYEAEIQLYFDFPESVSSSSSDPDNVVITFWAGDLFQAENGKTVRPGLTITAPVTRQVAVEDFKSYRDTGRLTGYITLGVFFLGLIAAINLNADTLPIWATFDVLVLITHLPLVNIQIPGRVSVLLSEVAKVLRLNFTFMDDWYKDIDVGDTDRPYTNILMHNGYMSTSIIINLFPILCLFGLLIVGLFVAKCVDCSYVTSIKEPHPNGRTEVRLLSSTQKVSNMIFRMMMTFFLEIFICILINFKAGTNSAIDFESISRVITIFMLAILTLFILLMFVITAIESDPERDPKQQPVATIHNLYIGMSNKRRTAANIYIIAFMLRRALYAVIVILMKDYPALQLMSLLLTSGISASIILRGRPYQLNRDKWMMAIFEIGFAWTCTLCMMFSPEYMHRSYTIAADMGNAIGGITSCICLFGLIWLTYSLIWQAQFNTRRRHNLEMAAWLARQPKPKKAKPAPLEPVEEESEESYRMDRRKHRQKQRQRKLDSMVNMHTQEVSTSKLIGAAEQDYMLDGEEAEDDGLNELEKLAGMNQQKGVGEDLVISDDELPDNPSPAQQEENDSVGANSVGAESSYSDFMQQWKNKLMTDEEKEATATPADMISNHSRRSNRSNRSNNPADNSPFRDITSAQTRTLLKGKKSEVIPEMQYEESEDSDGADNVILTKVERRRLNLLNSSRSVLPDAVAVGPTAASNGAEVQLKGTTEPPAGENGMAEQDEEDDFELL